MGWPYKLRNDRRNHKGKDIKQARKISAANMTKDYYLYYVKSACKSIKFTKTPADE